ncbi:MAG: tryptophanase [Firmicutes bacterium]|nr:tryptophanase [Bacillota bacterium]MCL2255535.1 tryptophanase [Bacillota bacterium]
MKRTYIAEPFRIKSVEPIKMTTKAERKKLIKEADYNLFALDSEAVYIDLLTDSGTGAMSLHQWAGVMEGDEAYAGARGYRKLIKNAKEIFGFEFIQPVHQGRAAEKVLLPILLKEGKFAISNMHFDTTRAHVEIAGARAIDCVVPEALDTTSKFDFKGNMDNARLEQYISELGKENIGVIIITVTNNSAGGQPVSMQNIRETHAIARKNGIPVLIDAARCFENAFFIKEREAEFHKKSLKDIVVEMFSYGDFFTMSAKKDAIVNMGGLLGARDKKVFEVIKQRCISFEGFVTYGGLSGRDLEALAIGLFEGIDEDFLRYRVGQMQYIGAKLEEAGVAYQSPAGGHAIFVDAQKMLPHIPYNEFPAQSLAVELYIEAGIRGCDIGSYMLGNNPDTLEQLKADFEFTRLAVPRRVYTQAHLDVIVDALIEIKKRASKIKGYKIIEEPPILRHFSAKLAPL